MLVEYNFNKIGEEEFRINHLNRSFMYGDSIFETIIMKDGKVRFLEDHMERLKHGLNVLDISLPGLFTQSYLDNAIRELAAANQTGSHARIKLQVWRKSGGLIIASSAEGEFLLTVNELPPAPESEKDKVLFYDEVRLSFSPYSSNKTGNMLPYILAGRHLKRSGANDLILFNHGGHVTECVYTNIFWINGGVVYTPAISCGCIAGIMRKQVIGFLLRSNVVVKEGSFTREELLEAEAAFTCNVAGISAIRAIENKALQTGHALIGKIKKALEV